MLNINKWCLYLTFTEDRNRHLMFAKRFSLQYYYYRVKKFDFIIQFLIQIQNITKEYINNKYYNFIKLILLNFE